MDEKNREFDQAKMVDALDFTVYSFCAYFVLIFRAGNLFSENSFVDREHRFFSLFANYYYYY